MNASAPKTHSGLLTAIAQTLGFVVTWVVFPEIGQEPTSWAGGPLLSYLWPILWAWAVFFAVRKTAATDHGKVDLLPSFSRWALAMLQLAIWAIGVWYAMATSNTVIYTFLREVTRLLAGLPVLGAYWFPMLVSIYILLVVVSRFMPGVEPRMVTSPPSLDASYLSPADAHVISEETDEIEYFDRAVTVEDASTKSESDTESYFIGEGPFGEMSPIGRYANGMVFRGTLLGGAPVGRYEDGSIFRGIGALSYESDIGGGVRVGRYEDGVIYGPSYARNDVLGRYKNGKILPASRASDECLATYTGPDDGGSAAAVLLGLI